ncbi:hypothetical protein [Microbacterium sp. TNHR37B]|uniref:hypothetical protein n=1 Tax=Microbacterium sp. TNHR37B TaxID=1775956 RepID=UPI0007B1B55E|nr:hypothetical protein [Microbacterium sp. TNHR37B]KZE89949.1 hypothetical protein AVP41_02751 [Microbacterium sp. TNHR37B]
MTDPRPTRRDLMKPAQLLGLAFAAAVFGGVITLVSMGIFQDPRPVPAGELHPHLKAWIVSGVVAGIVFIVTLVTIALLLLAVDPAQLAKQVDSPVLVRDEDSSPDASSDPTAEPRAPDA